MMTALATFDETLRDLVDDGQPNIPDCPYCDKPISGSVSNYGGGLMHRNCYESFGEEMETAFPGKELAPIHPHGDRDDRVDNDVKWEWPRQDDRTLMLEMEEREAITRLHIDNSTF